MTGASGGGSVVSAGGPASTAEGGRGQPSSGHDHSDTFDVQAVNDPELSDFLKFLVEGEDDGVGAEGAADVTGRIRNNSKLVLLELASRKNKLNTKRMNPSK